MNSPTVLLPSLPYATPLVEATLFAFDDRAFPFHQFVETRLIVPSRHGVVLPPGKEGDFDEAICYYGTVLRIENRFHLWYVGNHGTKRVWPGNDRQFCKVGFAVSDDGVHWEKPNLGLVEFNGSKNNNLVALDEPTLWSSCAVTHDPEEPDSQRRFKMAYMAIPRGCPSVRTCVAFSPDGFRWTPHPANPVAPFLEMIGLTRFRGMYYLNGQAYAHRPNRARRFVTYASRDFITWSSCGALTLDRGPDVSGPSTDDHAAQYEEVHLGAGLWNRDNVIIGLYGQWHGHATGDRRLTSIDIGLAISHDALHFHEPIPGFRIIPAREQHPYPVGVFPALVQGQGMENIGDSTFYWYSLWRCFEGTGVRLARWERDRLGMLRPFTHTEPRAISLPLQILSDRAGAFVNVSGLGPHSHLRVDILDEGFQPLAGYSGQDAAVIGDNGLRVPVRWNQKLALPREPKPCRVQVRFEGVRPEDIRFHALYIASHP